MAESNHRRSGAEPSLRSSGLKKKGQRVLALDELVEGGYLVRDATGGRILWRMRHAGF